MLPNTIANTTPAARRDGTGRSRSQHGVTLIELMVGIAIGLLVVAVATAALMVSRGVSGTVSDASGIQQQAAYALRVIGQQMRQAGSLYLNPNSSGAAVSNAAMAPVAFETKAAASGGNAFDLAADTISGANNAVTVGYRRYKDSVFSSTATQSLVRNCVGAPGDGSNDQRIESIFQLSGSSLQCGGNGAAVQPIIQNVANFQARYLWQDNTAPGDSKVRYSGTAPASPSDWSKVQAVEICLVLYGNEAMDLPTGSFYTDCDGTRIDMSTLTGTRARRMHLMFREVYQLRSQGLIGSVLPF